MTEQQHNAAREREEIASRVASFKATQEKFEREREHYFVTTLQNARGGSGQHVRRAFEQVPSSPQPSLPQQDRPRRFEPPIHHPE